VTWQSPVPVSARSRSLVANVEMLLHTRTREQQA
jgi:hypothetical protein